MTGDVPTTRPAPRVFRVALVPGVNPDRWLRVWAERLRTVPVELVHTEPADAAGLLRSGAADVALLRLPATGDDLSVMTLYTEATVVVVPKDHVVTVVEEIDAADLDDDRGLGVQGDRRQVVAEGRQPHERDVRATGAQDLHGLVGGRVHELHGHVRQPLLPDPEPPVGVDARDEREAEHGGCGHGVLREVGTVIGRAGRPGRGPRARGRGRAARTW